VTPIAPVSLQIDASSRCQLACPTCPTAEGRTQATLGVGRLRLDDFRGLLDREPRIAHVELSNYGEMFLNPELPEILACAHEREVVVSGSNGVNLNFAREEALEALVKYRVRALTCSIDGATPETYARYRVRGSLPRVLRNVDRIRELRRRHRAAFPLLDWQFVVFGHNEHEIEAARRMARERGMDFVPRLSWDPDHSPVREAERVRRGTGLLAATREEYRERHGAEYTRGICLQLWHAPVLNWDGRMLGCCVNHWGDFGSNAFEEGLAASLAHPRLEHARRMLMGRAEPRPEVPCTTCDHYAELRERKHWLTPEEVARPRGPGLVVGVLLSGPPDLRFARVDAVGGRGVRPAARTSGRLFRLGVDTAMYFTPPAPGPCTVVVQPLTASGWGPPVAREIEVRARPLCQELRIDLSGGSAGRVPTPCGPPMAPLPSWIR